MTESLQVTIGRQPDGAYVLRFERVNLRAEVAVTRGELESLELEIHAALSARSTP